MGPGFNSGPQSCPSKNREAATVICGETAGVNHQPDLKAVVTLHCKRWSCETCLPRERWKVIRKAAAGNPNIFITLTCNPHLYETPDEAARDMVRSWRLLVRSIKKAKKIKRLPFCLVFERTKKGWPHLHILIRAPFIDQKWLSERWQDLCGAKVVDIRAIQDTGRASSYVAKYVGKEPFAFEGTKRWWRSRDYNEKEDDPPPHVFNGQWETDSGMTVNQMCAYLESIGYRIFEIKNGVIWMEDCLRKRRDGP